MNELFTAAAVLSDHARRIAFAIAQGIDGSVLREFGDARVGVDGDHGERRHYFWRGNRIAQAPPRHGETLGESVDDQGALWHARITQHGNIFTAVNDASVDFV